MDKAVLAQQGGRSDAGPAAAVASPRTDPAPVAGTEAAPVAGTGAAPVTAGTGPAGVASPADPATVTAGAGPTTPVAAPIPDGGGAVPASPAATTRLPIPAEGPAQAAAADGVPARTGVPAEEPATAKTPRWAQLPYAIVLAAVAGGLAWAGQGQGHVQAGMVTVASALLAAAVLRLVLPDRAAGLLVSRRRVLDVLSLASLGGCLMATVLVLPSPA